MFLGNKKKDVATIIVGLSPKTAEKDESEVSLDEIYAKDLIAAIKKEDAKEVVDIFCSWHKFKHESEEEDEDESEDLTEEMHMKSEKGKDY